MGGGVENEVVEEEDVDPEAACSAEASARTGDASTDGRSSCAVGSEEALYVSVIEVTRSGV